MEKLDALYKMAVIRDDAKAIEEIADMALEAGPSSLSTATAALAKDIKNISVEISDMLDD